jgi:hypothetical protein
LINERKKKSKMPSYLVIRLVPDSPVDGATFATYLEDLRLQVIDANTLLPWSGFAYSSPMIMVDDPIAGWIATVSAPTNSPTAYSGSSSNYGSQLTFDSTDGISVGSYVFSADQTTIPPSSKLIVTEVSPTTISIGSQVFPDYVPAGTVVTFLNQSPSGDPDTPAPIPFSLPTTAAASTVDGESVLNFASTDGITVGMGVAGGGVGPNTTVIAVPSLTSIMVSPAVSGSPATVTFTLNPPYASFQVIPSSGSGTTLNFPSGQTKGIAVGMMLAPISGTVAPGTTVTNVTQTTVTVSPALTSALTSGQKITLVFPLSSGIVQHTEIVGFSFGFFNMNVILGPAAVATAVIPLNAAPPLPDYLDITISATRGTEVMRFDDTYYNVLVQDNVLPSPEDYQLIPSNETSLYLSLPPQPGTEPISLEIPTDGSAPPFDDLYPAIQIALGNDPVKDVSFPLTPLSGTPIADPSQLNFAAGATSVIIVGMTVSPIPGLISPGTVVTGVTSTTVSILPALLGPLPATTVITFSAVGALIASPENCRRIAYDIVWSYQNTLPAPPDPLESLYTNPPNPGGSNVTSSSGSNSTSSLETDRQKFEGTLSSFYSTRNSTAERLTKFVAAVSAAVFCEQTSLNSTAALLEFPVSPSSTFATEVESELLVQGLGISGTSALNFGVPAAFFYAVGANLDKSTNAQQRFQQATGDAIERLLQQFTTAENANVINDTEAFVTPGLSSPSITSFQAARRLVALAVSAASTSPSVTVLAGTPLAKLITDWLATTDPTPTPPPNPPLTYENTDFNIWTQQLASADPQGYLYLDLDSLTQGYVIPPFTATPTGAPTPATLTFAAQNSDGTAIGIGVGMTVTGNNIAPGTVVTTVSTSGSTLTVTLLPAPLGSVTTVSFNGITAITTLDCPSGNTLTFAAGSTAGIASGMLVSGPNIAPGTVVSGVNNAIATVTVNPAVFSDVPLGSVMTFVTIPSTLADQIFAWLPSTTNPATPQPTVGTLIQVTATQWTSFFTLTGNPTWLPPFTQPIAPGVSQGQVIHKPGYTAGRIKAFIRAVQQFFTVSSAPTSALPPEPGEPTTFDLPAYDPFKLAMLSLPSGFTFGSTTPLPTSDQTLAANMTAVVNNVFPTDVQARAWLSEALTSINELYEIALAATPPSIPSSYSLPAPYNTAASAKSIFSFSVAEALYARGFRSASDITKLTPADFQQALTGTIAYDFAATSLYGAATSITPPKTPSTGASGGSFQPINPDASLVNCVPPPCLSPTGPIAYLQEMLNLTTASTCDNPFPGQSPTNITLGQAVAARRGQLGSLLATCANLETPLPLVDIVNECLENLGAPLTPPTNPSGVVYDTSADKLAGLELCREQDCSCEEDRGCHDPATIFAALPEYSTPATPVTGVNDSVEPQVYNNLEIDFSSCDLPYCQALDVSRTYLGHFGTCRFEELRTFRKCITEFALSPANPPSGFQPYLWRYPVRIEIAIEYLGITPEEYSMLFHGTAPLPCANTQAQTGWTKVSAAQLYGYPSDADRSWMNEVSVLSNFLRCTCLTYCEFLELWNSGFVQSALGNEKDGINSENTYPKCEPCCLDNYRLQIGDSDGSQGLLLELAVVIRLWRKLKDLCGAGYSFQQLYDICTVLQFNNGTNPEFVRQLAAFQILRDHFHLPLVDHADHATGTTGADRTHLLALWVGGGAKKWRWAVDRLLEGVECHARDRYGCERPRGEGTAHMADNLDALSRLAGFNPPTSTNPSTDTWNSTPGCTLRFAEVLAKICASRFRIGDLLYLFNATPPLDSADAFPLQDSEDALNYPLDQPENEREHTLWKLREALLAVEVREEELCQWTWPRLVDEFRDKFGYAPPSGQDPLLSIGQHFFPDVLQASGFAVSGQQRQYRTTLTSSAPWNSPGSPFQYDSSSTALWTQLPLRDEAVAAKLSQLPELTAAEQIAVQDLYFAARLDLAFLSFVFPDWQSAELHLIQEPEEHKRWEYFLRHFALANARRKVIAEHLAKHVEQSASRCHEGHREDRDRERCHQEDYRHEDLEAVAALVLSSLLADENTGTPWESPTGGEPTVMWTPQPSGGAIAALLGLVGTGLLGEYEIAQQVNKGTSPTAVETSGNTQVIWREVRGPLEAFGHERDMTNSPVPTILPSIALSPAASPLVTFNNGYAVKSSDGLRLGGAEAIHVRWSGVLLVEREGDYAFHAGAPAPDAERPDFERAEKSQWLLTLKRGQKTWTVLNHQWPGDTNSERSMPRLRPGAYQIVIEYAQAAPDFTGSHLHPQRTGFQVKYAGPDTDGCLVTLPVRHLYRDYQNQTLDQGIQFLAGSKNAQAFLKAFYTSTLRDIRRTYQRAFKAVLFAGKLGLSARRDDEGQSELGYMLANGSKFAGAGYYLSSGTFTQQLANFDFNLLPLRDNYFSPTPVAGDRSDPSLQQTQALFDSWERLFDYQLICKEIQKSGHGPVWHLFQEALVENPTNPAELLRYIGADPGYSALALNFCQDQTSAIFSVTSASLEDDRWLVRVWHADRWLRRLQNRFHPLDMSKARPDLWASPDPSAALSGASETGNANLSAFLTYGFLENGRPRRYLDFKRLNDGLRERGRRALISYLCHMNRVQLTWMTTTTYATAPNDLSDLLLLDVETGLCERITRIEEAISAVQAFIRRNRLGLEQEWKVTREFVRLWDSRFETYHVWERCKRRELYRENWIDWAELDKARRVEAFRFLESELRSSTLTMAAPGGLDWWADDDKSLEHAPKLLQRRVPSGLQPLTAPPQSVTREGLGTLGRPEYAGRPTWLAAVPQQTAGGSSSGNSGSGNPPSSNPGSSSPGSGNPNPNNPTPPANTPGSPAGGPASPLAVTKQNAQSLVEAVATGSAQPQQLPFWMESAMKLGTRFLRIAAAGIPQAALAFVPHRDEPESACCRECGCHHPVLIDEYYFWLINTEFYDYTDQTDFQSNSNVSFTGSYQFGFQDSHYDQFQQQSAEWNDEDQVPPLLAKWQPNPAVRLAWCRVHNGQFGQPQRSAEYLPIANPPVPGAPADLVFLGRGGDSLYFYVPGYVNPLPPGYSTDNGGPDSSPPGFRYDLPTDDAVALPQLVAPPAPPSTSPDPGGLLSYPFFAYHDPGARLFPASWFAPSLVVADILRAECRYELALRWYKRAFDPLQQDCAWMHCPDKDQDSTIPTDEIAKEAYRIWEQHGRPPAEQKQDWFEAITDLKTHHSVAGISQGGGTSLTGACCDSTKVTEEVVRQRSLTLHFCHTLLEWGHALMRRRRSPEAFQQARLLFDTAAKITGRRPQTILLPEPATAQPVSSFTPAYAPLNPRLLDLYSLVADRLELIRNCLNSRRLRNGRLNVDMPYFGDSPWREGWRRVPSYCADDEECCRPSPYRFTFQIQKALELVGRLREFESTLLSIHEKCDAEYLASLHAVQEREMLALGLSIRQDQWRDADWQIQALQQTKDVNQTNLIYYNNLYQNGLINDEIQNLSLATNAMQTRTSANIVEAFAESFKIVPDFFVGAMSTFSQIPIGTKLAGLFETIGKVMQTIAEIQSATAAIDMTQAGWDRRSAEWCHQMRVLPIEIQQTELLILGAQRRRDSAMQELNNHQRGIENATEVLDFLRHKFTSTELYLWYLKEAAAHHSRLYDLTLCGALEAQRAYNFERGHTTRRFIPEETWDNLHEGLTAGEKLELALRQMEKDYLDENIREYELTKHFSLRLHFPLEFMRLKATGSCVIDIPEWMFDLDYPGQYMRRIKSLSLTIPCVTGPYTGVHCRATLLSSMTRIDPRLEVPATDCCCDCRSGNGYEACPHDPRIVRTYGAREAIATSSGQNDSGLFELNFRDERRLPFEFHGAACRLRIEFPPENNYFPMETVTDLIVNMNLTARESGEMMRQAASEAARKHLPGSGWCFFDVRHEFPDAWQMLHDGSREGERGAKLHLRMHRKLFPFIPGRDDLSITSVAILFEAREHEEHRRIVERGGDLGDRSRDCSCDDPCGAECACPQKGRPASRVLEFKHGPQPCRDKAMRIPCVASEGWPGLYYGIVETEVGSLGRDGHGPELEFRFPAEIGEVERAYLLCQYRRLERVC